MKERCATCGEIIDVEAGIDVAEVVRDDKHVMVHVECMFPEERVA